MIRRRIRLALASLFLLTPLCVHATVTVQNLRQWRAPDHTRLVFDLSGSLEHRVFVLTDPDRIVIDLDDAELTAALPELDFSDSLLSALRTGRPETGTLRIVLDLKSPAQPRTFVLGPTGPYGHRLVIDLLDPKNGAADEAKVAPETEPAREPRRVPGRNAPPKLFVVAVDAGHGGEDPGALGRRYRTREKDVTLAIARELARLINQKQGMRAVLIRDGDYYIRLRDRFEKVRKARSERPDLFISIHADAAPGRQASGSSVYALSEKGATDAMTRILAERENASDLIGGVSISDKDDVLAKVLLDLSHTKTKQDSLTLGSDMLMELRRVGPVHAMRVRQAGFAVLKAPDIPSVLVETAFISNPAEEKKLRSPKFQREMAQGIFLGIQRFAARNAGGGAVAQRGAADARAPALANGKSSRGDDEILKR
jgi:N-acetylmuramoyl-L-alanine amidase